MTTKNNIANDNRRILLFLYHYKHMTTEDIHYYLFPQATRRTVERRLRQLLGHGLIDAHVRHHGTAGRSARIYHLLLGGARQIGKDTLGNQHYRHEREDFRRFALGLVELRHLAARQGWVLHEAEDRCQQALYFFLAKAGRSDVSLLIPARMAPDLVLCTDDGAVNVVIRGHPHSGRGFWTARCKRYQYMLSTCRAIAVVLDAQQRKDAQAAMKRCDLERRVLVTDREGLRTLPALIERAKQHGQ